MDKAIGEFCTLASAMSTDPRSVALTPVEVVVCWESWLFILLVLKEEESYFSKPSICPKTRYVTQSTISTNLEFWS
jgi:hypothetical protein